MEQFQNKSHHEGWNTYKLKPSQRMNRIQYKVRHPRIQVLPEAPIRPPQEFSDTSTWISKTKAFPIRPAHDNTSAMDTQWSSIKSMVGRHDCLIKKQRVSYYTRLDLSPPHKNPNQSCRGSKPEKHHSRLEPRSFRQPRTLPRCPQDAHLHPQHPSRLREHVLPAKKDQNSQ